MKVFNVKDRVITPYGRKVGVIVSIEANKASVFFEDTEETRDFSLAALTKEA